MHLIDFTFKYAWDSVKLKIIDWARIFIYYNYVIAANNVKKWHRKQTQKSISNFNKFLDKDSLGKQCCLINDWSWQTRSVIIRKQIGNISHAEL